MPLLCGIWVFLPFWHCILFFVGLKMLQLYSSLCELALLHTLADWFLLIMVQSEKCQHRSLTCLCSKCMGIIVNRSSVWDSVTVSREQPNTISHSWHSAVFVLGHFGLTVPICEVISTWRNLQLKYLPSKTIRKMTSRRVRDSDSPTFSWPVRFSTSPTVAKDHTGWSHKSKAVFQQLASTEAARFQQHRVQWVPATWALPACSGGMCSPRWIPALACFPCQLPPASLSTDFWLPGMCWDTALHSLLNQGVTEPLLFHTKLSSILGFRNLCGPAVVFKKKFEVEEKVRK